MTPPGALQAPAMGPSSPYGSGALMGGSEVDGYELVRSCEHFIHTSSPPARGALGRQFSEFSAASRSADRICGIGPIGPYHLAIGQPLF